MQTNTLPPMDYERLRHVLSRAIGIITRLYPNGSHFVYELIQNANDALAGVAATADGNSKGIAIVLRAGEMLVSNNGRRFDEAGVHAICSIGESTKDLTPDWDTWYRVQGSLHLHRPTGNLLWGASISHYWRHPTRTNPHSVYRDSATRHIWQNGVSPALQRATTRRRN